mgnify:CR=1 FL=1
MTHQITTIAELTETLPIIYGAKVIQPLVITGMTGGGKSMFCKTIIRTTYANSLGLLPDDIEDIKTFDNQTNDTPRELIKLINLGQNGRMLMTYIP